MSCEEIAGIVVLSGCFGILVAVSLLVHILTGVKNQDDRDLLRVLVMGLSSLGTLALVFMVIYIYKCGPYIQLIEPGIHNIKKNITRKIRCNP